MERVIIKETAKSLSINMKVVVQITKEKPGLYASYCPSLDVWGQGESAEEAKRYLKESIRLLIEASLERGTFSKWEKKFDKINKKAAAQAKSSKEPTTALSILSIVFKGLSQPAFC